MCDSFNLLSSTQLCKKIQKLQFLNYIYSKIILKIFRYFLICTNLSSMFTKENALYTHRRIARLKIKKYNSTIFEVELTQGTK